MVGCLLTFIFWQRPQISLVPMRVMIAGILCLVLPVNLALACAEAVKFADTIAAQELFHIVMNAAILANVALGFFVSRTFWLVAAAVLPAEIWVDHHLTCLAQMGGMPAWLSARDQAYLMCFGATLTLLFVSAFLHRFELQRDVWRVEETTRQS
jgi:hypothetical protein